jgi:hypothetical protein
MIVDPDVQCGEEAGHVGRHHLILDILLISNQTIL